MLGKYTSEQVRVRVRGPSSMENAILTPASRSHAVVCQLKEGWPPSFGTSTSSTVTPLLAATRSHRPAYIGHQDSMPILCDASGSHIASSLPPPLETRHLPSLKREQADTIAGGIPTLISFIPPSGRWSRWPVRDKKWTSDDVWRCTSMPRTGQLWPSRTTIIHRFF